MLLRYFLLISVLVGMLVADVNQSGVDIKQLNENLQTLYKNDITLDKRLVASEKRLAAEIVKLKEFQNSAQALLKELRSISLDLSKAYLRNYENSKAANRQADRNARSIKDVLADTSKLKDRQQELEEQSSDNSAAIAKLGSSMATTDKRLEGIEKQMQQLLQKLADTDDSKAVAGIEKRVERMEGSLDEIKESLAVISKTQQESLRAFESEGGVEQMEVEQ